MDEHPTHWNSTLMGWDFWKDATEYEEQLSKQLETSLDLNLHRRFPFNLIPEQSSQLQDQHTPKDIPSPKHRHRLSVPDFRRPGHRRRGSLTLLPSRFRDLGHRARSRSPVKHATPTTPVHSWSPLFTPLKTPDEFKDTTIEASEIPPSPHLAPTLHTPLYRSQIATLKNPLMNFRGGFSWTALPTDRKTLALDLFWPCRPELDEVDCLDTMEIKPLCQFRSLRSLKIVGMLQSYQTYIWQAVWMNLNLDELELGMALEPVVTNPTYSMDWRCIQHGWKMDSGHFAEPAYHGYRGGGELHHEIGHGEYLDKHSMEAAKIRALAMGSTCKRLAIKKLTLSGFVVDAGPFIHWFDPRKLRSIHFKGQCVDAGFWLPRSMAKVSVRVPRPIDLEAVPVGILKLNVPKDLNVVESVHGTAIKAHSPRKKGISPATGKILSRTHKGIISATKFGAGSARNA